MQVAGISRVFVRIGAGEDQELGPGVAPDFHVTITFIWGSYV